MTAIGGLFLAFAAAGGGAAGRWSAARGVVALASPPSPSSRLPDGRRLWALLHGTEPQHIVQAEDATGLSLLKAERRARHRVRERDRPELDPLRRHPHRARRAAGVRASPAAHCGGDRPGLGRHRPRARRATGADAHHLPRDHRSAARHAAGLGAAHAQSRLERAALRCTHRARDRGRPHLHHAQRPAVRHHRSGRAPADQRLFRKRLFVGLFHAGAIAARARRASR